MTAHPWAKAPKPQADAWGRDPAGWRNSAKVVRGEALNRCPCGQAIRTFVALCTDCQLLADRFWRDLAKDLRGGS